ncbi:hypothetical protein QNM99_26970 [Pseudomonas sp. PCH446]
MQKAQNSKDSPDAKATLLAAAESQVSAISGSISTVSSALTTALQAEGSSTSGTSVNTTA